MPELPLVIESLPSHDNRLRVLCLSGPILLGNFFDFQAMVRADDSRSLVIDMTKVPYVDSSGVGCLVGAHVSHERNRRRFAICGVNERVRNILRVTCVESVFTIYSDLDEAMAAFNLSASA